MTRVAYPGVESREPGSVQHPRGPGRAVARMAVEFGLPVAVYYGLRAGSVGIFSALLIGAVVSAVIAAVPVIRRRRLDGMATYVTAVMAGGVGVSLLAGSTQFLLARGALLTGVTGLWFIASLWSRRPLAYLFSQPLLEGRFRWPADWDELWDRSPPFRRMWRVSSLLWGIGTLADAALRVVMAYTLPPDLVPRPGHCPLRRNLRRADRGHRRLLRRGRDLQPLLGAVSAARHCRSRTPTVSTTRPVAASARRGDAPRRTVWLTGAVSAGTLAVSVAALASPSLMQVMTRNLPQLHAGQWWRIITPVLVQPDGWGQLLFNLLGIAVVGAALERRTSRAAWTLIYLLGGVAGIVAVSAWHPADLGGGSSDAVAALIGALTVLLAAENHDHHDLRGLHGRRLWAGWPAQVYCVFFASYLTALDVGGVWWSILAGNATVIAFFIARRALSPTGLTRACLLLAGAAGVTMTAQQDGHGLGILAGAGIAALILLRRRTPSTGTTRRSPDR